LPSPYWINKYSKTSTICLLCLHLGLAWVVIETPK
jgi:hypothetical protein